MTGQQAERRPAHPQPATWLGKRVLVTGATGFIGRLLARRLTEAGADAWAAVYPDDPPQQARALPTGTNRFPLDVTRPDALSQAIDRHQPRFVFHLAAVGVTNPAVDAATALQVNVGGTVGLLEALRNRGIERVVLAGTSHEYGARETKEGLDPFNFYAASKVAAWAFARAYWRAFDLPVVVARPFQVYGPGQPEHALIPSAFRAALGGEDFPLTPGEQQRDFVFVEDVVGGLMAVAAAQGIEGESVDLGTGKTYSVGEIVERIWQMTAAQGRMLVGALPYRPAEVMCLVASAGRTARLTGWRATTSLEQGLRQTMEAIRAIAAGRAG